MITKSILKGIFLFIGLFFITCSQPVVELSVEDFKFDGPLGSQGTTIEKIGRNHFKVAPGHAPEHPDWANMVQFEITQHARGNSLRLDVEFPHDTPHYLFNDYSYSWSYDMENWHPVHWKNYQVTKRGSDVLVFPTFEKDNVYFGHQAPFTYEHLQQLIEKQKSNPFVTVENIGESLGGKTLYRLVLTDASVTDKKWVHFFINQHPGEHYSHYRMLGMFEWLLSKEGRDYLKKSINHFVFFMSPDAPQHGWYRVNAQGVDMNRSYRAEGSSKSEQTHEGYLCQLDLEQLMQSENPVTDLWAMHTWGGAVETIMLPGPEIGNTLGQWTDFRQRIIDNDADLLIEPLKITTLEGKGVSHWNNGPHIQFGITTYLCEGAGNFYTKVENLQSGAVLMKSIAEYYE